MPKHSSRDGFSLGPDEQLFLCTTRIAAIDATGGVSHGTGFYVDLSSDPEEIDPYVCTNKHVVEGAESVRLRLRRGQVGKVTLTGQFEDIELPISALKIIEHPDPNVDLVAIGYLPFANVAQANKTSIHVLFMGIEQFAGAPDVPAIPAICDVLMVGYPIGLMDEVNNLPIVRRGVTATPFSANFRGRTEFAVDIACFPGSSGSPVFCHADYAIESPAGRLRQAHALLGVLYAGPQYNAAGEVIEAPVPTAAKAVVPTMINVGYCIKAERIAELRDLAAGAAVGN